MNNTKRVVYAIISIILFLSEVFIAQYFKTGFIREYFGDILVVILIYTFLRIFIPEGAKHLSLGIFIFAIVVELLQLADILGILGLKQYEIIRVIAGSQFDFKDIICYAVGCALCALFEIQGVKKIMNKFFGFLDVNIVRTFLVLLLIPIIIFGIIAGVMYKFESIYIFVPYIYSAVLLWAPFVFTIMEIYFLCRKYEETVQKLIFDLAVLLIGFFLEAVYLIFISDIDFSSSWDKQLYNSELHTPVESCIYIFIFFALFIIGRIILAKDINSKPPLVTVLAIACMYAGCIFFIIFIVQIISVIKIAFDLYILLLPINIIIITIHTVMMSVLQYKKDENRSSKIDNIPVLNKCNALLENAKYWPLAGLVMLLPLLGLMTVILILFGQAPDTLIKMWTETSDFTLSEKVSPQNLYYDEHYLCTVAAGGHQKVVKPKRRGVRHGHEVIVNRQLCVANAFEQILEIHTPRFHKGLRNFYDTYGFPVAKLIKSKWIADVIWFVMKPLEYIFVIVLYLTEVHPEDRIALQYTGKDVTDFIKKGN